MVCGTSSGARHVQLPSSVFAAVAVFACSNNTSGSGSSNSEILGRTVLRFNCVEANEFFCATTTLHAGDVPCGTNNGKFHSLVRFFTLCFSCLETDGVDELAKNACETAQIRLCSFSSWAAVGG